MVRKSIKSQPTFYFVKKNILRKAISPNWRNVATKKKLTNNSFSDFKRKKKFRCNVFLFSAPIVSTFAFVPL